MFRKSHRRRRSLHQHALGFGIVTLGAYAGCVGDPPVRERPVDDGSGGTTGGTDATGATGGSGKGGKGGSGQGGSKGGSAGSGGTSAGGTDNEGGAGAVDGGSAGMVTGGGGEGGDEECASGLVSCPGSAACATDLDVGHESDDTVDDCGACGVTCSLTHAESSTCSDGACEPECSDGYADCNAGTANDGCEADLSSPTTCGECGRACATTGVATADCTDAKCTPACTTGFFDCNLDDGAGADDGCELYGNALATCGATCESAGSPCATNQVCNAGVCGDPAGLVKFSVPFTATNQNQRYADKFSPFPNLTNSALVMRVYAPGAVSGSLFIYPTDSTFDQGSGVTVALETLSEGWVDIEVPIAGASGGFEPAAMFQLTFEILAGAGPWPNPTVLYVDSVWSSNGVVNDTFDTDIELMVASTSQTVAGSSMTWVAGLPPPP